MLSFLLLCGLFVLATVRLLLIGTLVVGAIFYGCNDRFRSWVDQHAYSV